MKVSMSKTSGVVNTSGRVGTVGGDIVGRDKITGALSSGRDLLQA
jgi:hypothetical protein